MHNIFHFLLKILHMQILTTMNVLINLLFFVSQLCFPIPIQSFPKQPSLYFINPITQSTSTNNETEYFEVTQPLPTDDITPTCSINLLNHTFENTSTTRLISVPYTPPPATCEWSHVVLDFQAQCKGTDQLQHDGIAGVWIDGVELLRTSMAQSNEYEVAFWNVRKDVTRYSSVITQNNLTFSLMLETPLNEEFNDVYYVNVSLLFYNDNATKFPLSAVKEESLYPYETPADLIIPVSSGGLDDEGFWFKIHNESDVPTRNVEISQKTYKAVLEVYVSFHGDDEFWYMNPPDSYITANNLKKRKANGAYREVLVTIDGKLAGTVIPFPVIYTRGINPLFWKPVVSIGAFDLPSYDINFTPYLGLLLDNKNHSIGFQVAGGVSFWLVDANLHLWLDRSNVKAIVEYEPPSMEIEHGYQFEGLEGEFEIELEKKTSAMGWIQSSLGFLKTKVTEEINFQNKLKYLDQGTRIEVEQEIKTNTNIKITTEKGDSIGELEIEKTYPLKITIVTQPGSGRGGYLMSTSTVVQGRTERFSSEKASMSRVLKHNLNCTGWMLVKGNGIISGSTENHQNYEYNDEFGCYSRKVDMVEGDVIADQTSSNCVD